MKLRYIEIVIVIMGTLIFQGCFYGTLSTRSGGYGYIRHGEQPIAGASVSLTDIDGTETVETNLDGAFRIKPEGRKVLYSPMENPIFHFIELKVTKYGFETELVKIRTSIFGENDFDFGTIQLKEKK